MPEVLYSTSATQIGVESTPQTGVAANKKFQGISIMPAIKLEAQSFKAIGNKFPTIAAPGKEWTVAKVTGYPTYDEIVYLLSSGLAYAAPAQQSGTAAYLWTHAPSLSAADTYKSYSIENGDAVRAQKTYGNVLNSLGFTFDRNGVALDGEFIGLAIQDGITMTSTPTVLPAIPILSTQVDVKISTVAQASLTAASALTRCELAGWSIGNRWLTPWMLGTAQTAFVAGVEGDPKLTAKLSLAADSTGTGLLTQMRAGSSIWMRIKATGALIASTFYYDFQTDLSLKIVGEPSEFKNYEGIKCLEWNFEGFYDSTWTKTIECKVINTTTAL